MMMLDLLLLGAGTGVLGMLISQNRVKNTNGMVTTIQSAAG